MQSIQTNLDKEYMLTMVGGVICRLRESYQQGLIKEDHYQTCMDNAYKIRDNYEELEESDVQKKLQSLTQNCGSWRLHDILMLHLGYDYMNEFEKSSEEIQMHDCNFSPLFYTVGDVSKSTIIMEDSHPDHQDILNNLLPLYQIAGGCLVLTSKNKTFLIFGTYVNDTSSYCYNYYTSLQNKYKEVIKKIKKKRDQVFVKDYMKYMGLRDFITMTTTGIITQIIESYDKMKELIAKDKEEVVEEFRMANSYIRREMLTLLLMRQTHLDLIPRMRGFCEEIEFTFIFTSIHIDLQKELKKHVSPASSLGAFFDSLVRNTLDGFDKTNNKKTNDKRKRTTNKSLRERVNESKAPPEAIEKALQQVQLIEQSHSGEAKAERYINGFLKIPFGVYKEDKIKNKKDRIIKRALVINKSLDLKYTYETLKESRIIELCHMAIAKNKSVRSAQRLLKSVQELKTEKRQLLANVKPTLDKAIYGHVEAKQQFEQIVAQWMNGDNKGAVIGIQGPPGNGKTSLVKEGLSKCLKDSDGTDRPFVFIPLGGLRDGVGLVGHSFTYVGSIWGKIADGLMRSKCMNPIFYFDELDKVSNTERGQEIIGILTHLTDSTQNSEFFDEYFQGVPLDLSKALFVFTFNDAHRIDRILRDRIKIIKTSGLKVPEKYIISQNYLLPKIREEIGLDVNDFQISNSIIGKLIEDYTAEAGVRKLKELLYDLVRESNRRGIAGDWTYPYKISDSVLEDMLKRRHPILHDKIHPHPVIGIMNGLYANSSGLGGITKIEATKCFSKTHLELKLTGSQGAVMKESMHCALSVAWSKLNDEERETIGKDNFGIHIHCPAGGTPKDGPSAGGAITLTLLSLLRKITIPNDIAMTGEVDLRGNLTAIGGLDEKLLGAKKAGVRKVFIPEENIRDWKQIVDDDILSEDENFKVIIVNHIDQVIQEVFSSDNKVPKSVCI